MDQQQQNIRRRAVEAGAGAVNHPPPQPCPRCNSNNTKFCYFNNYSLSQPRYFCKGCRRYWTQGGTLRNVPVGGGCRKSKRPKLSSPSSSSAATSSQSQQLQLLQPPPQLPSSQLMINAQDHQLSMFGTNSSHINNSINVNSGSDNAAATMMSPSFFGSGNPGFLSSLAAMQGVSQPLNFGPNLGLLQGFTLPNFEHHRQQPSQPLSHHHQQQRHQEETFQSLYSAREVGSSSAAAAPSGMENWGLRMQSGPPAQDPHNNTTNITTNNSNTEITNNGNNQNNQWPDFLGTSGLDDP